MHWSQVIGALTSGMKPASVPVVCGSLPIYKSKLKWALCKDRPTIPASGRWGLSLYLHTHLCAQLGEEPPVPNHCLHTPEPMAPDPRSNAEKMLNEKAGIYMGGWQGIMDERARQVYRQVGKWKWGARKQMSDRMGDDG